jgi:hypothetical protein
MLKPPVRGLLASCVMISSRSAYGSPDITVTQIEYRPPKGQREDGAGPFSRLIRAIKSKETLLWWLHSIWALLFGLGVMWLGAKNFVYLRVIVFHIGFIWLSSLFLPVLLHSRWFSPSWQERVRLVVNYFNRNFYQQLLFFLLPIYYASTTMGSRNVVFLVLLSASAVLSTLDVIYDRYLSVRWQLTALFFAFNLFASINVMLPVMLAVSHRWSLWISAILALVGFHSMLYRLSGMHGRSAGLLVGAAACVLLLMITVFAPYIPPAPLTLASVEFGKGVESLHIVGPLSSLPADPGRIFVVTAIRAPLGLKEGVRHRWYLNGRLLWTSREYLFSGGSRDGYRIWTMINWPRDLKGNALTVDVETGNGQLIGRARLTR